jgi:hypothetical protein
MEVKIMENSTKRDFDTYKYAIGTIIITIWLIYMIIIYPIDYSYPDFFESEKYFMKSKSGIDLGFKNDKKEYYGLILEKKDSNKVDIVLFTVLDGAVKYKDVYFNTNNIYNLKNGESPYYLEKSINEYTGQIPGFRKGADMYLDSSKENTIGILTKERQKKFLRIFPNENHKLFSRDYVILDGINIPSIDMLKNVEKIPNGINISEIKNGNTFGYQDKIKDQIFALNTPFRTIVVLALFPLYIIFVFIAYIQPGFQKLKNYMSNRKSKKEVKTKRKKQIAIEKKASDPNQEKLKKLIKNNERTYNVEALYLDTDLWENSDSNEVVINMSVGIDRDKKDNYYFVASFPYIYYKSNKNSRMSLHLKLFDTTNDDIKPAKYKKEFRIASLFVKGPYKVFVSKKIDLSSTLEVKKSSIINLENFKIPLESIDSEGGGPRKYKLIALLYSEQGIYKTSVNFSFKFPKKY